MQHKTSHPPALKAAKMMARHALAGGNAPSVKQPAGKK
jgi:hypothetical protein